jgi:hypothetical protein
MSSTANQNLAGLDDADRDDADLDVRHERRDHAPDDTRKIGRVTLVCLILNRIIGYVASV